MLIVLVCGALARFLGLVKAVLGFRLLSCSRSFLLPFSKKKNTRTHATSSVKRKLRVTLSDQVDKGPYVGAVSLRPCMPFLIDIPCLVPFALTSGHWEAKKISWIKKNK
jgi:hypothetical protein